ncbi:hypothetical protein FQR65_LT15368 [Abscondita terminalis]|nr:hypothetical protein FQR65_LT15368 [Abscondita terminalis]
MDIMEVNLVEISNQYIDYILSFQELDIEVASEYLEMAAYLIELKSKMLIPKEEVEIDITLEEREQDELLRRLVEYHKIKEVSQYFKEKQMEYLQTFSKQKSIVKVLKIDDDSLPLAKNDIDIDKFAKVFLKILEKNKKNGIEVNTINYVEISPEEVSKEIQNLLLEGLLFINGDDGVSLEDFIKVLDCEESEVVNLINELTEKYKNDVNSAFSIQKFASSKFRLSTKKEHSEYYIKLENIKTETKLSSASLETLSIIAYKGPITKQAVEEIRGVNCDTVVQKLLIRNLIKKVKDQKGIGGASIYVVTDVFLKYFNINSLDELPKLKEDTQGEKDIFSR